MNRNLTELTNQIYDLLVIGGGIYGACVAWEASLRGLSVALVEKADFGGATSANSLKIIHGGLRYLQNADFKRMRESIQERTTLMRIAPHLVHPLPVLIPTYGHGMKGKEALRLAMSINDLISCDRNQIKDPQKHIPNGRIISQQECQRLLPGIPHHGLTGGAIFHDAQVYNSERMTISFLHSAVKVGATIANYVEATGFLQQGNRITGIIARDSLSGNQFEIRAKTVVNTCGPWINRLMGLVEEFPYQQPKAGLARAMNLIIRRPLCANYAVGISNRNRNSVTKKGNRFLFMAPWRGQTMIGTNYAVWDGKPDDFRVSESDIQDFIQEINQAYPLANLTREDVSFIHGGLLPRIGVDAKTGEPILAKHYQIYDSSRVGLTGLISVVGVKYTTARDVAQKVVDRVFQFWGQKPPQSLSSVTPIYGGKIDNFEELLQNATAQKPDELSEKDVHSLVYNYGCAYPQVLKYLNYQLESHRTPVDKFSMLKAEVIHAVREEMAQKLTDVVFRRTELGSMGNPGNEALQICTQTMAMELGWNYTRIQQELQEVNNILKSTSPMHIY
ncbi:glycerol-3-phosphate dehydrogenase/oxidase [Calothrix rhizosoleniae]|uniref:glycerol-3-phosphate dehydrogenase/oxidase n=1 Tax=Calothrix rhizosoleniae TaxID=888997 RepID=UPI000B4A35A7|nr:glycerol-3-phosphate dehydrogenase/oxidase [Calothrix rhizosoleniae]